ncbi:MAG: YgaP family membrane protein [Bacteriovoracaceae bacterium]
MKKNIHPIERVTRVIIGLVLMSLAFVGPSNLWFLLGIIPVLTGFIGWCPPYQLLGISTCKVETN